MKKDYTRPISTSEKLTEQIEILKKLVKYLESRLQHHANDIGSYMNITRLFLNHSIIIKEEVYDMTNYLIFGNGFIGNRLANFLQDSTISYSRINTINDVSLQIKEHNPEIVINAIGKTGRPNIDWCEDHREETLFSNVTVPILIAEACKNADIRMVHIGSGCIYQTDGYSYMGFSENDKPNFKNSFYSRTKIFAENILSEYENVLQLRIRMPIDDIPSQEI